MKVLKRLLVGLHARLVARETPDARLARLERDHAARRVLETVHRNRDIDLRRGVCGE